MEMIILPMLVVIINITVVVGVLYLIFMWVNKFILLKQEHNDLLREILKKMADK